MPGEARLRGRTERPKADLRLKIEMPPVGCAACGGRHYQSPSQFTLVPYRGVGRYREAHIRVQKEPVVWPVGTGTDYIYPEGSPDHPCKGDQGILQVRHG